MTCWMSSVTVGKAPGQLTIVAVDGPDRLIPVCSRPVEFTRARIHWNIFAIYHGLPGLWSYLRIRGKVPHRGYVFRFFRFSQINIHLLSLRTIPRLQ